MPASRGGEASRTAEYMALFRAVESRRPSPLFDDPVAARFLRPGLRAAAALSRVPLFGATVPWFIDVRWPGARASGVARTRLIDDELENALERGTRQVVILGAGYDSRSHRIPGIEQARVFEVDAPWTLAAKRRTRGSPPSHAVLVELDFETGDLGATMRSHGFDEDAPAFVIWEGVTNYLTAEAVDTTLAWVATATAHGSRLIFTYVHRGVLDGSADFPDAEPIVAKVARSGEPWTFGIDPAEIAPFLEARGLTLAFDRGSTELRAEFMGDRGRHLDGYSFYRIALAEVRA